MPAQERSITGVRVKNVVGHEWDIVGGSTADDEVDIDISRFKQDITNVLSTSDGVSIEESTSNDGDYTVSSITDNNDGTATIALNESISDSTVDGQLAYRLLLEGETSTQLEHTENLIDLITKDAGYWGEKIPGLAEWSLSLESVFTDDSGEHKVGGDGIVKVEVKGQSGSWQEVEGLDEAEITFSSETDTRGGLEDPLWRYLKVTGLGMEVSMSGDWYDPQATSGAAYDEMLTAQENANPLDIRVTIGALTFEGEARPGDWSGDFPGGNEDASGDWALMHDSEITRASGVVEDALDLLISTYFARDRVSSFVRKFDDQGNEQSGATAFTGESVLSDLTFTASRGEELTVSATQEGDGPLKRITQ